jgi:hypothetical protein
MAMVAFEAATDLIQYLRSPEAIRDRAAELFNLGVADRLEYFTVDLAMFDRVINYVDQITRTDYPDLNIPLHSRWRHFPADRVEQMFAGFAPLDRVKAKLDLVVPSILLDAGAGHDWRYVDAAILILKSGVFGTLTQRGFDNYLQTGKSLKPNSLVP